MTKQQIEAKILSLIDTIRKGQPHQEDSWVELKRDWPAVTSRKIAAHANAARSQPILWVIGVNDKTGEVFDAPLPADMSTWLAQFNSSFNEGIAPQLESHFVVPCEGKNLYAMYFQTDRAPYVMSTSDNKYLEVPFRRGTETRSAKRSDLLKILVPITIEPELEIERASMYYDTQVLRQYRLTVTFFNRSEFPNGARIFFPAKLSSASLSIGANEVTAPVYWKFEPSLNRISGSNTVLEISGPGHFEMLARFGADPVNDDTLKLNIQLNALSMDKPIIHQLSLKKQSTSPNLWAWRE